jgi:hypothetical protein
MFQNVLMDPKILEDKQISLFIFSMSFGIFVSFQLLLLLLLFLCLSNFIHMFTCNFIQI